MRYFVSGSESAVLDTALLLDAHELHLYGLGILAELSSDVTERQPLKVQVGNLSLASTEADH